MARREAASASLCFAAVDGGDAQPEFIQDRVLPTQSPLLDRREPVAAQCRLWQPCQFMGQLPGDRERLSGFDDAIGETDALGFLAGNTAPRQDQVHRPAVADQPRQPDCAEIHQRYAEASAIDAEDRIAGCYPEVAPEREFEASGHRRTLDRGDHRLRQFKAGRPHRAIAAFDAMAAPSRGRLLQVEAGTERATPAGQDRDRCRGIAIEAAKGGRQCLRRGVVDGIARFGALDRDDGNRAVDLVGNRHQSRYRHSAGSGTPISHSLPPSEPRHWVTRRCRAIRVKPSPTCGRCMIHSRGSPLPRTRLASLGEFSGSWLVSAPWPPVRSGVMTWPYGANASAVNSLMSSMCRGSVLASFIVASSDHPPPNICRMAR